jgi:hypothetical protein
VSRTDVSARRDEEIIVPAVNPDLLEILNGDRFVDLTINTPNLFNVEFGALVYVGSDSLWFNSKVGFTADTVEREGELWDLAMASDDVLLIPDLVADSRFGAPLEIGGAVARFVATIAIHGPDGSRIGVYCIARAEPQNLPESDIAVFLGIRDWIDKEIAAQKALNQMAEMQHALLPRTAPSIAGYEFAGACVAARGVGGDFYDWYPVEGGAAFTLADVMGKGLAAGLLAATVRATIRSASREEEPVTAVNRTAETLALDLNDMNFFVTVLHGRLRAEDGFVSFVDAGHGLSIVIEPDGSWRRLMTKDVPLGVALDGFDRRSEQFFLTEGAMLVSFSDGVLDLFDGSMASVEAVAELATGRTPSSVVEELARRARRDAPADDVTVIAIRRQGV